MDDRKLLGSGGAGSVYLAVHKNELVAVKKLHNPDLENERNEFIMEMRLLAELDSPFIIRYLGGSLTDNILVTEFMPNGDLRYAIMTQNPMVRWENRGGAILLDIARGLAFLHGQRFIHRDLKSPNILLSSDFRAKLADVGIARALAPGRNQIDTLSIKFSLRWASPENFTEEDYTILSDRSDIYAFGVILWEVMTQSFPWDHIRWEYEICNMVKAGQHNPIPEDCPPRVAELMKRCWSLNPNNRPSAQEVADELEDILNSGPPLEPVENLVLRFTGQSRDGDPKLGPDGNLILKEGTLSLRSVWLQMWHIRYFTLTQRNIIYWTYQNNQKAREIRISLFKLRKTKFYRNASSSSSANQGCMFEFTTFSRTYTLVAPSITEAADWVAAIELAKGNTTSTRDTVMAEGIEHPDPTLLSSFQRPGPGSFKGRPANKKGNAPKKASSLRPNASSTSKVAANATLTHHASASNGSTRDLPTSSVSSPSLAGANSKEIAPGSVPALCASSSAPSAQAGNEQSNDLVEQPQRIQQRPQQPVSLKIQLPASQKPEKSGSAGSSKSPRAGRFASSASSSKFSLSHRLRNAPKAPNPETLPGFALGDNQLPTLTSTFTDGQLSSEGDPLSSLIDDDSDDGSEDDVRMTGNSLLSCSSSSMGSSSHIVSPNSNNGSMKWASGSVKFSSGSRNAMFDSTFGGSGKNPRFNFASVESDTTHTTSTSGGVESSHPASSSHAMKEKAPASLLVSKSAPQEKSNIVVSNRRPVLSQPEPMANVSSTTNQIAEIEIETQHGDGERPPSVESNEEQITEISVPPTVINSLSNDYLLKREQLGTMGGKNGEILTACYYYSDEHNNQPPPKVLNLARVNSYQELFEAVFDGFLEQLDGRGFSLWSKLVGAEKEYEILEAEFEDWQACIANVDRINVKAMSTPRHILGDNDQSAQLFRKSVRMSVTLNFVKDWEKVLQSGLHPGSH